MTEISFTSKIVPVTSKEFSEITCRIGHQNSVNYPWTIKDSILAKDSYTKNICDCTACLITNGQENLMMHLNPAMEQNHAFSIVLEFLRNNLDLKDNNLHAVLTGSKKTKKSLDIYNKFSELLNRLNIPFSELKNGKTPTDIAYKTSTDEFYITNSVINRQIKKGTDCTDIIKNGFEKVSIAKCDEI